MLTAGYGRNPSGLVWSVEQGHRIRCQIDGDVIRDIRRLVRLKVVDTALAITNASVAALMFR